MREVVVCGPASWNHVVALDHLPEPVPHMQFALGDHHTLGGTSAGKALHLTQLGRATQLHTVVGTDPVARLIEEALARGGVPVTFERVAGPSERHLNLMGPAGERVSLYLDVPGDPEADVPPGWDEDVRSARAVVLDLSARSRALAALTASYDVPVWTDVHDYDGRSAFHQPFLDVASFVFMNADKLADPLPFLRSTVSAGARAAVCTLGAEGAVAVGSDGGVHRVPAAPVAQVVDTNGAGDAFMAGFLVATLDGGDVDDALAAGAAQAATALGSKHLSTLLDTG
jgi:sugar/nucleoside kinase (ribokinase family)